MTSPVFEGLSGLASPALIFDLDAIERNLDRMLEIVGDEPSRLRPHMKTHKCGEILELQLERGIRQIKCATLSEAELAARSGIPDILIAYPLVNANAHVALDLVDAFPDRQFSFTVDSPASLSALERPEGPVLSVMIDFDCGMHRTGIPRGKAALELAIRILESPRLRFSGVHAYDGQIHVSDLETRKLEFETVLNRIDSFIAELRDIGIEVPSIVSGGSPTFAFHAAHAIRHAHWQCSPGTPVLWDMGYGSHFKDLPFEPAAFLLARIVSRPENFLTLDLGHKAVSAENPIDKRVRFPGHPGVDWVSQSEEHLVISCPGDGAEIGSEWLGVPWHVCPTVALHEKAYVVRQGKLTGESWNISARDRGISLKN
ncbi:MAG: D-TA family PLP-dependent enzyme [Verrucomicrobiota bacterium]